MYGGTLQNCTVSNLKTTDNVFVICAPSSFFNCIITNNTVDHSSGIFRFSIPLTYGTSVLRGCLIANNSIASTYDGDSFGAIFFQEYNSGINMNISNCTLANNHGSVYHGTYYYYRTLKLFGSICYNSDRYGYYFYKLETQITFTNNALWVDEDLMTSSLISFAFPEDIYISNCAIGIASEAEYSGTGSNCIKLTKSSGAFFPFFNEDWTLKSNSPLKDAGSNSFVPADYTVDLKGNPRISGSTVDIGAYEYK